MDGKLNDRINDETNKYPECIAKREGHINQLIKFLVMQLTHLIYSTRVLVFIDNHIFSGRWCTFNLAPSFKDAHKDKLRVHACLIMSVLWTIKSVICFLVKIERAKQNKRKRKIGMQKQERYRAPPSQWHMETYRWQASRYRGPHRQLVKASLRLQLTYHTPRPANWWSTPSSTPARLLFPPLLPHAEIPELTGRRRHVGRAHLQGPTVSQDHPFL